MLLLNNKNTLYGDYSPRIVVTAMRVFEVDVLRLVKGGFNQVVRRAACFLWQNA